MIHRFLDPIASRSPDPGSRTPDRVGITTYLHALHAAGEPLARASSGLRHLAEMMPGCSHAAVMITSEVADHAAVATSDTARRCDELQRLLDGGPGLHAFRTGHSVVSHDLGTEPRWPSWRQRAVEELHVRAALAVPLSSQDRPVGALSLYSGSPQELMGIDLALLHALAAPLAAVLAETAAGPR